MEFTFKRIVKSELIGCRLCRDIYFRPNRRDLVESHLKNEHKINLDNLSDSEDNIQTHESSVKAEPQQTSNGSTAVKSRSNGSVVNNHTLNGSLVSDKTNGFNGSQNASMSSASSKTFSAKPQSGKRKISLSSLNR